MILKRLGPRTGEQMTNAAYLLFWKTTPYTSESVLRVGRFKDLATIIGDRSD